MDRPPAFVFRDNPTALATCRELGREGIDVTVLDSERGPAACSRYARFVRAPSYYEAPAEWVAFDRIDPIGDWRGDAQAAQVAVTSANIHRGKRKPYEVKDFLLSWEPRRGQSLQEMADMARAATLAFGGKVRN